MRKVFLTIAGAFCAATLTLAAPQGALAGSAANFSKIPDLEMLLGPKAQSVAYFRYRKWHHGCYRPYFCKYKHHGHYKHCYWGKCYYYKKYHLYKPHHYYKKKHHYYKRYPYRYRKHH